MNPGHALTECGFSLLELLTALLITGIILTFALPTWQTHGHRVERSAALAGLQQAAQCQAKRSIWTPASPVNPDPTCLPRNSGAYRFLVVRTGSPKVQCYEWRAEPQGKQRGDACGTLVLDHKGGRSVLGTAERARRCWQGR